MIALYRAGDTHEIHGVKCEMKRFNTHEFHQRKSEGWFTRPKDAYKKKAVQEITKEPENTLGERSLDDMPDEMIRQLANEAGIGNWHNRRVETLKVMLRDKANGS